MEINRFRRNNSLFVFNAREICLSESNNLRVYLWSEWLLRNSIDILSNQLIQNNSWLGGRAGNDISQNNETSTWRSFDYWIYCLPLKHVGKCWRFDIYNKPPFINKKRVPQENDHLMNSLKNLPLDFYIIHSSEEKNSEVGIFLFRRLNTNATLVECQWLEKWFTSGSDRKKTGESGRNPNNPTM